MEAKVLLCLTLLGAVLVSGCAVSSTPIPVSPYVKTQVLAYSDPIANGIMTGLNSGDYTIFSSSFSTQLKTRITTDQFSQMLSVYRSSIGKFVSWSGAAEVMEVGDSYSATYTAQFTDDAPVTMTLIFKKSGDHMVEQLSISARKISGRI